MTQSQPLSSRRSPVVLSAVLISLIVFPSPFLSADDPPTSQSSSESSSLTKGPSKTSQDEKDPISMATGEYYFFMDLLSLGGRFPLDFRLYYGSQVEPTRMPHGLPLRFLGNHRITLWFTGSDRPWASRLSLSSA